MRNRMLYLIGVDHSVQHDGRAAYQDPEFTRLRVEFPTFLDKAARETGAKVIAEESNSDVLKKFAATKSIPYAVASEIGVRHLFCEPCVVERKQLGIIGIKNPADFRKREASWMEKLMVIEEGLVLFVLGADHVGSFSELAKNSGFSVSVIEEYYGREYFALSAPWNRGC
jgi:hypothetical protein